MSVTFDTSILLGYYQSKLGATSGGGSVNLGGGGAGNKVAPTAPWSAPPTAAETSALVKAALAGRGVVDEGAAQLDLPGASADYRKLFALYQGLGTLTGVAEQINRKGISSFEKSRVNSTFAKGLAEISTYLKTAQFEQIRVMQGAAATSAKATLGIPKAKTEYLMPPLTSSTSEPVPAFQGDVKFTISVNRVKVDHNVSIDLGGMGSTPRTFGNVVNYINGQLQAAGVETRIVAQRVPGVPRKIDVGGKEVTLPATSDQWAMKVKIGTSETVSFSAPSTADAVYVAQSTGDPNPDKNPSTNDGVTPQQLLKFQTDTSTVPGPLQVAGEANWVEGRIFAEDLGPSVKTVHATTGPDGSVYMLADVTNKINGQDIKGEQDVALLKYDSAGKLIYTRTMGAAGSASGLALALSADGKIAVAGSVTGALGNATEGAINSGATGAFADKTDSFVTLYNADGEELWTQRRGARQDDEATSVGFGADGTVYVAGRSKSALPAATPVGDWDNYIQAFKADATGKVKSVFTHSYGTVGSDRPGGMVIDGTSMVTSSIENGHAIVRRFDLTSGTPVLTATRDLGDLQGGDLAGLALDGGEIVIAGSTSNAALSGGAVKRAHAGGVDAFAVRLSADLTAGPGDSIAYYGGSGDDRATSLAVSGGKVWIGGAAGAGDLPNAGALPGQPLVGKKDGFLASLDMSNGAIGWARRFTGKDGQAAPSAIAVAPGGASILDRLGLPSGTLDLSDSQRITAASAIRAGDTFTLRPAGGRTSTVTIEEKDTLETLAQKVRRASGFQAKVSIVTTDGARQLKIEPLNPRTVVEIGLGKADKDALSLLGIPEGVVRATTFIDGKSVPADGKGMLYGLGLGSDLNLEDKEQFNHAMADLSTAMGVIRTAYKDLVAAASPQNAQSEAAAAAASGPVPAYLTNQIANYQAALNRLTGGG
jgi:hypothetical protein